MLIVGVLLFGVFFTSKTWMYDDTAIAQTPFHESVGGLNQTTIVLRSWEYNPENQIMEVTIETMHTGTDAVEPTFTFKAEGRDSNESYPAQKVYESDDKMVIQIEQVPENYHVVGLFITEHRDEEILKQEYKQHLMNDSDPATLTDGEIKKSELPEPEETILVGDYRKIDINHELVTKTDKAYKKETILAEMERIKNEISMLMDERIPFQEELISTLKKEKKSLKNEIKFETESEKLETKKDIQQKENAIQDAKKEIQKHQEKIKELRQKYQNREEKLNTLMDTKEETGQQRESKNDHSKTQANDKNTANNDANKKKDASKSTSSTKEKSSSEHDNKNHKKKPNKKKSESEKEGDSSSKNDNKDSKSDKNKPDKKKNQDMFMYAHCTPYIKNLYADCAPKAKN